MGPITAARRQVRKDQVETFVDYLKAMLDQEKDNEGRAFTKTKCIRTIGGWWSQVVTAAMVEGEYTAILQGWRPSKAGGLLKASR